MPLRQLSSVPTYMQRRRLHKRSVGFGVGFSLSFSPFFLEMSVLSRNQYPWYAVAMTQLNLRLSRFVEGFRLFLRGNRFFQRWACLQLRPSLASLSIVA